MKERPILFNDEMVRAILAGRKTQTRRIVKPQTIRESLLHEHRPHWIDAATGHVVRSPFGGAGDSLWVRECWGEFVRRPGVPVYRADDKYALGSSNRWRPSIHMPRWASRVTLEIIGVRVERLQDIIASDALAEGVSDEDIAKHNGPVEAFCALWQSIYGADSWAANQWVWVYEFQRISGGSK